MKDKEHRKAVRTSGLYTKEPDGDACNSSVSNGYTPDVVSPNAAWFSKEYRCDEVCDPNYFENPNKPIHALKNKIPDHNALRVPIEICYRISDVGKNCTNNCLKNNEHDLKRDLTLAANDVDYSNYASLNGKQRKASIIDSIFSRKKSKVASEKCDLHPNARTYYKRSSPKKSFGMKIILLPYNILKGIFSLKFLCFISMFFILVVVILYFLSEHGISDDKISDDKISDDKISDDKHTTDSNVNIMDNLGPILEVLSVDECRKRTHEMSLRRYYRKYCPVACQASMMPAGAVEVQNACGLGSFYGSKEIPENIPAFYCYTRGLDYLKCDMSAMLSEIVFTGENFGGYTSAGSVLKGLESVTFRGENTNEIIDISESMFQMAGLSRLNFISEFWKVKAVPYNGQPLTLTELYLNNAPNIMKTFPLSFLMSSIQRLSIVETKIDKSFENLVKQNIDYWKHSMRSIVLVDAGDISELLLTFGKLKGVSEYTIISRDFELNLPEEFCLYISKWSIKCNISGQVIQPKNCSLCKYHENLEEF